MQQLAWRSPQELMATTMDPHGHASLWHSPDSGAVWAKLPATGWSGGRITVLSNPHGALVAAPIDGGIAVSTDDGHVFRSSSAASGTPVLARIGDQVVPSDIQTAINAVSTVPGFLATGSALMPDGSTVAVGVFLTGDHGIGLVHCEAGGVCAVPRRIAPYVGQSGPPRVAVSPSYVSDRTIAVWTQAGLLESHDGERTFQAVADLIPAEAGAGRLTTAYADFTFDKDHPATQYLAMWSLGRSPGRHGQILPWHSGGVYRSVDGGTTWNDLSPKNGLLSHGATAVTVRHGMIYEGYLDWFESSTGGLACSGDNGGTWSTDSCSQARLAAWYRPALRRLPLGVSLVALVGAGAWLFGVFALPVTARRRRGPAGIYS